MATTGTSSTPRRTPGISAAAPPPRRVTDSSKNSSRAFNVVCGVVLGVFAVLWLIPSLWAIKTSLTPNSVSAVGAEEILRHGGLTLEPYANILRGGAIWDWYLASFFTAAVTTALTVVFASMSGYALSRLQFRGRGLVFVLMLAGIMIPSQVLVVPIFQMLDAVSLLNTYWAVILPQIPYVIAVFVFKQFFDGLPKELEESARIDGAGFWRIYRSIIMPLSKPVVSAMAILAFVNVWNNLLLPLFVVSNPELMTIPVGLATVQGSFGQRYSDIQASSILGALPLVILFLLFQRRIVEGVAGTGLKG
ncbi:carbohydrate ABC transporter permease [Paenibacillus sp. TRM 82003]|uniref:carbohydrate ABC transporter permease n=1 Tax=Kineococcus sp. TRM81007 TaxID=2925831 RepID=UPI001F586D7D|nr:carbohydrate ABC transporter permease [Kineococcus sp. TRM81007]MCI2238183.1 carbohydrate ABC transporter permease [Kineococcus sp. TRM81007]MCI3920567.1 carbohydrate ABC transporter permease [Paenibacillus sp. TRM 82003]